MEIILGRRLRELRAHRKQTQEQLAVYLGITTQAVSKWYMRLGKNYARLGDRQETLHCLERAVYHAAAYDGLEQGRYTALIVNRQQFSKAPNGGKCMADRQREMQDVCFDFVKEDVRFQKLLSKIG